MDKRQEMIQLRREAEHIRATVCDPASALVLGEGDLDARLMIVGEAPGHVEDERQRPFVGPSGQFLDAELARAGIERELTYITGVVKCRTVTPGGNANRTPTKREIDAWLPILLREIEIVTPRIILCLGSTAASTLIHERFRMSGERGEWRDGPHGIRTLATYHPAYVKRWSNVSGERLYEFRRDIQAVARALAT